MCVLTYEHRFPDAYFSHSIEAKVKTFQLKSGYKIIKFLHFFSAFVSFKSKNIHFSGFWKH